ncbi:DUF692 family protein [Candidatus Peregrinibacteria bacterium]|nr:DUF692 family protein [Candidatus Peregrinibacteria bacterium]
MTRRIASPISTFFADFHAAEGIMRASDCLECRDHFAQQQYPHEELFHFEAELIKSWSDSERSFIQKNIAAKPDLRILSFHAGSSFTKPKIVNQHFEPGGERVAASDLQKNARENVMWLRSVLDKEQTIALENNNYYATPAYDDVTDGSFLTAVLEENNIALLFDIAHAHITACNRGLSFEEYTANLPLQRAVQIHISRCIINPDGSASDAHLPPDGEVFAEVKTFTLRFPQIRYFTIEYYQDAGILLQSLVRLRALLSTL